MRLAVSRSGLINRLYVICENADFPCPPMMPQQPCLPQSDENESDKLIDGCILTTRNSLCPATEGRCTVACPNGMQGAFLSRKWFVRYITTTDLSHSSEIPRRAFIGRRPSTSWCSLWMRFTNSPWACFLFTLNRGCIISDSSWHLPTLSLLLVPFSNFDC